MDGKKHPYGCVCAFAWTFMRTFRWAFIWTVIVAIMQLLPWVWRKLLLRRSFASFAKCMYACLRAAALHYYVCVNDCIRTVLAYVYCVYCIDMWLYIHLCMYVLYINTLPDFHRKSNYRISFRSVGHQMGTTWCLSCMCSWRYQGARTDNCRYVWPQCWCDTCHRIPHPRYIIIIIAFYRI